MLSVLISLAHSEEAPIQEGTYSKTQQFLPLLPPNKVNAKLLLIDYPDHKVELKRFMRISVAFTSLDQSTYSFQEVIGHIVDPKDSEHFVWNMTTYGSYGRVSNEDTVTHMHYATLDPSGMIPGTYNVDFYALLQDENHKNSSVLLYNDTLTFYETIDYKYQIGSIILYIFFAGILLGIVYLISSKDKSKIAPSKPQDKKKVLNYDEIHNVRSNSPSSGSGRAASPRGKSPGRNASPK